MIYSVASLCFFDYFARERSKLTTKNIKLCFAASSGGHYEQILMLKPLMKKYNSFLVTEKTPYKAEQNVAKTYFLRQVNRKELALPLVLFSVIFKSLLIFIKERPDIVITTGVLSTIPICILAKLFNKKLIYIESFAKVKNPTKTGKLMYKVADQFYVQWPQMKKFFPKAIFLGGIY